MSPSHYEFNLCLNLTISFFSYIFVIKTFNIIKIAYFFEKYILKIMFTKKDSKQFPICDFIFKILLTKKSF